MPVFERGEGGELLLPNGRLELGGGFCAEQHGLAGWFNIHYRFFCFLFFLLPYLTLPC